MQCAKLDGRFLKVKAKVSGFLIVKIEKRNMPEQVIVTKKSNTILTTALPDLLNAFQTYMSGVTYSGQNAPSSGIILTIQSGQQITLTFSGSPTISVTSNSAILLFEVADTTINAYTAVSEELVTTSAGYNIPIATANLPVTKQPDEILTLTWIITISISTSGNITYIPTPTPQPGGSSCGGSSSGCSYCTESGANSEYPNSNSNCYTGTLVGLSAKYMQTNFITTQLFTDMFYNTYTEGSPNLFTQVTGTTLIIYTLYCMPIFAVGVNSFFSYDSNTEKICYFKNQQFTPIYLQLYFPSETQPYIGVQIEFTT